MTLTYSLIALVSLVLILTLYLVYLSRHKKSGTGPLDLIGASGTASSVLSPEGSVLVNGELWRARISQGTLAVDEPIRVVGVDGHLLLVESSSNLNGDLVTFTLPK
ncbi:MAG TPA: NfeD family protein [Pyrinomonadaceae bacterium]|jgi:membrane-bound ClpP family serine protease|nr:NfeD family protein [Pyrinomonadaceae bacterium]